MDVGLCGAGPLRALWGRQRETSRSRQGPRPSCVHVITVPDDFPSEARDGARLLAGARPTPSPHFVEQTERRLLCARPAARRSRRPLLAACASGSLVVLALVVATLLGGGPLAPHGTGGVLAAPTCTTVSVVRVERRGVVVEGPDGQPQVVSRPVKVKRPVRHCR